MTKAPKVFISYSHDSREHSDRVWELCERLRRDGVNCCIDLHVTCPPEGWPRWCRNQIQEADFVLVVCTEAYHRRYEGKESPGTGLGVNWEGFVITQTLYETCGKNTKFIPIVFSNDEVQHIPTELRAATRYELSVEAEYENLFRRLTDQPARKESEVCPLRKMPSQAPIERRDSKSPVWTLPIPPNPLFTGRAQALTDIDNSFGSTGKAALVGLGGVGKTQTAAHYAYLRRDNYEAVLWVAAASRESLVSDFVALAARLGIPQMGAEETVAAVKRWLETHEKWLLVLDNADDLGLLGEFIPAASPGHVLVTTQAQATGTVATAIEISEMEPEEGGYFIVRRAKLLSHQTAPQEVPIPLREVAETISRELGGLPLALDQAGAFIEESACGLSTFLELYRERRAKLLERRGNLTGAHPDSVVATFALCFEKIERASPAAADVLRLCAFLSPDAIPEEVFTTGCPGLGVELERVASDPLQLNEALARILRYSLVRRNPGRKTMTIHRLVQAVLQDEMTVEERRRWADRAVRAVNSSFPKSDFGSRDVCERLIRHAEVCGALIREYALDSHESARLLNQAGTYLLERARFKEAEGFLERAVDLASAIPELRPAFLPVVRNNLAAVYHAIGKYDLAEKVNKQVLEAREQHLGPDHPEVAQSLNNLGTVYMVEGKYREAKAVLKRALAIKEKSLNANDPELATTLNNLGGLHEALAEYSEAESAYRRALKIRSEVLAAGDPDIALTRANLAQLYYVMEKYPEAKELQPSSQTLEALTKVLGQEHPTIATTLNNCALLYQTLGDFDSAQKYYERAKGIDEKLFGRRHRSYAVSLCNLASLSVERKQYAQAESLYNEALGILQEALGADHLDVSKALSGLGRVCLERQELDKAERLSKRSFEIRRMVLGREHPDVALALINLGQVYHAQGRFEKALQTSKQALRLFKKAFGPSHPKVADCCEACAEALRALRRETAAIPWEERAKAIRSKAVETTGS